MDLQTITDELAIRTLTASYTDAINRFDFDDIAQVYDEHTRFTMMERPTIVGVDAIIEMLRTMPLKYDLVMQLLHSGVVQVDGDTARARWQITEMQVLTDGSSRFVAGRYEDEYARRAGGWKFSSRTFTARYLGDMDLCSGVRPDNPPRFALFG